MSDRVDLLEGLRTIGRLNDGDIDIADVALRLAGVDVPNAQFEPYRQQLNALANDMASAARGVKTLSDRVVALRAVVFRRHGYRGDADTYDDLRNANLIHVIDRRKGLPVALGILVIHAARGRDWQIAGLNFPGHFLLQLSLGGESVIVDPFNQCQNLTTEDLEELLEQMHGYPVPLNPNSIRTVGNRDVLVRLQNNIKIRALKAKDYDRAIDILETITAISPGDAEVWHERAVLEAGRGNIKSAVRTLEEFLASNNRRVGDRRAENLLSKFKQELN